MLRRFCSVVSDKSVGSEERPPAKSATEGGSGAWCVAVLLTVNTSHASINAVRAQLVTLVRAYLHETTDPT